MNKNNIFEDDDRVITPYRKANNLKQDSTELRPDEESSPLKLSKEQLGRFSWALLHSVAASFPQNPSIEDKKDLENFLFLFAKFFPCKICGSHFKEMLNEFNIKNNNREELVYYLCDLHNNVNKRLGKPIFDCKKAFDFWGGNCGCDGSHSDNKNSTAHNDTISIK